MPNIKKQIYKRSILPILAILSVLTFFNIQNTEASGSYGWFASKVEYVDSVTSCASNQASIEFWLVENNTKTLLTGSIGSWKAIVRNSDLSISNTYNFTNQKQSSKICFDPVNQGLQVVVQDSANYFEFIGPTIKPSGAGLNTMVGNHFRGYVELQDKSDPTGPNIESIYPTGQMFSDTPLFEVKTNFLNSVYGATEVKSTRIYAINQTTNVTYSFQSLTSGGVGTRNVPGPSSLPSGIYFWTFHQELNGSNTTNKYTAPAIQWIFGGIPSSGAPSVLSFTVDKTPPTTAIPFSYIFASSTSPIPTDPVAVNLRNDISDTLSGLASTTIFVTNSDGSLIIDKIQFLYPSGTSVKNQSLSIPNLNKGETYRFYAVTEDNLGNIQTSAVQTFSIPAFLDVPTLTDLDYATTTVFGQYYLKAKITSLNGSGILKWGTCWSTTLLSETDLTFNGGGASGGRTCTYSSSPTPQNVATPYQISHLQTNLPAGTTIYYRAYAANGAGFGYTEVKSFNVPISPYDPSINPPTVPLVQFIGPYYVQKSDRIDPGVSITSAGGMQAINKFGICIALSEAGAISIDPNDVIANSGSYPNCRISSPTDTVSSWIDPRNNPILPYYTRNTFTSLLPSTIYHFKVFATNDIGVGSATGSASTQGISYYFRHANDVAISPKIIIDSTKYNSNTNRYDYIDVQVVAVDDSSEFPSDGSRRDINFTVDIDLNNDSSIDDTGTDIITTHKAGIDALTATLYKTIRFFNVPLGSHKLNAIMNEPESFSPQTNSANRERPALFNLTNPNVSIDSIAGSDDGSGSGLVLDPELKITASPSVVRFDQSTTLSWEMKNVNGGLNCTILGPDNFDSDGKYTFNHTFDSTLGTTRTGTINSGNLKNTQIFKFECTNPLDPAVTYSTTTRVTVLGTVQEI